VYYHRLLIEPVSYIYGYDQMNETTSFMMEEEIDLRKYIAVLIKHWYWIVGLAIVAAVVAFVVSSFTPPMYQATALVTVTQPRYRLQFDNRIQNIPEWNIQQLLQSQYRTYPILATSDDLLQQVAEQTGWNLSSLKGAAQANGDNNDPSLLTLMVKGENAKEVAGTVNIWAEVFVTTANKLYGGGDELERFKQQQETVAQSLAKADTNLTAFRKENGFGFSSSSSSDSSNIIINEVNSDNNQFGLIGQRLQSKIKLLTDYEAELVRLQQMQSEVELLSKTVTANTSPGLIAGLLSEMINAGIIKDNTQPYQIKLDSVDPRAGLTAMATALQSRITAIETEMKTLEEDIAALQAELAIKQEQLEQLLRERDVKAETYAVISRKVQEAQIDAFDEGTSTGKVQIASRAVVPTNPTSSGRLRNSAVAGVLGLMVGVFGAFAIEWWRNPED
jgi:succinoglycan biosynthesis transport protein ExoP